MLLLVIVVVLAYRMFRRWRSRRKPAQTKQIKGGQMVRCHQCGLFVPESEAVRSDKRVYCSEAHRRLDQQDSVAK